MDAKKTRRFRYVNAYGVHKELSVSKPDASGEQYNYTIWNTENGDYCSSGTATKEQINKFLAGYGIEERLG